MKIRQKKYNSKTAGNELEKQVAELLNIAGIPYDWESTVTSAKVRNKGSVDFKLLNPVAYIECKRYTKRLAIGLKDTVRGIKWSQIEFLNKKRLDGYPSFILMQEKDDLRLILADVSDVLLWWSNTSEKSISLEKSLEIGIEITDFKFLNVDTSK